MFRPRRPPFLPSVHLGFLVAGLGLAAPAAQATESYPSGEMIVTLVPGASIDDVNTTWGTQTLDQYAPAGIYLLYADGVGDLEAFAETMEASDARVAEAEANYLQDTPEGVREMVLVIVGGEYTDYEDQGLTDRIGLDDAHLRSRGAGVTVAVIDTGVDLNHEVFAGRISSGGYDFVDDDPVPDEVGNGIDDDGDGTVDEGYGHGTMVAGIVALVAPDAMILPIRALDDEGRAGAWTIVKATSYAIDAGADVINMSFGVPRSISPIGDRVGAAADAGIVVVAGAGNENREEPVYFPGEHDKTFLVTAVDSLDRKADFADFSDETLVSAPGTGVRSAYPGGGWALGSGCSFATPMVSGEVALIRSLLPALGTESIETLVEGAVEPIYGIPANLPYDGRLGSGRIYLPDALPATVAVGEAGAAPHVGVRVSPNPTYGAVRLHVAGLDGPLGLEVFDVSGRRLTRFDVTAGSVPTWDGTGTDGRAAPAGTYFVRLSREREVLGTASIRKLH